MTCVQTNTQIVGKLRDHPFKTVRSTAFEANESERTIERSLTNAGVKAYRPAVKPKLTAQQKTESVDLCLDTCTSDKRTIMG